MSRTGSFLRVGVAYTLAVVVALLWVVFGPRTDHLWLDALVADVLATLVIFAFSRFHGNSSFYDAFWSVIPPLLTIFWWARGDVGADSLVAWLVSVVVMVWAVRLTWNWARSFPGLHHEDWRYGNLRDGAGRWEFVVDLVAIHLIPTGQVFLGMLPVYVAVTRPDDAVGWLAFVATAVGLGAVALEYVADEQLRRFVATKQPGQTMDRGLWAWSRHPNYFGEFSFWFALALFGVAVSPGDAWWLFVGAIAMLAMFLGASIPMMEARSLESRASYSDVVERVSRFVPRPPRKVAA
ncbi:hypothetical protein ASG12_08650 [Williamsia sp. Leaf354]|uniref:DUF1295 domain-containing protein n=1 Tax=Williamsia sp. Leaf354 TaxID=1736349 RepID=UPI0006F709C2|nr:DUF1295 domain-containing protein [Williamsia sp. Leaf354]KQR98499.1 hypothetical protein ASG12_08650 [Williamsia sp. Leaf354]